RGEVAAMRGALELAYALANERPGDDSGDLQRLQQALGDGADRIEPFQTEMRLVHCDLEHRIRRGVADRLSGFDVLLAEPLDDLRAGGVAVAENAGDLRLGDEVLQEVVGEGRRGLGEVAPVE